MHVRGKFCVDLTIAHVVRAARTAFRERRARDDKRGVRVLELILNADGVVEDGHVVRGESTRASAETAAASSSRVAYVPSGA